VIGIRSTLPACNCIYRLYDCGIYGRFKTELPSSVYNVPIDEVNLSRTCPFKVLQHGCLRIAVNIQDSNKPQIVLFYRSTSSVPSRRDWIDRHLLRADSGCDCYRESFVVCSIKQLASLTSQPVDLVISRSLTNHNDSSFRRNRRTQIGSSDLKAEALGCG
jgi:hypothetical protein